MGEDDRNQSSASSSTSNAPAQPFSKLCQEMLATLKATPRQEVDAIGIELLSRIHGMVSQRVRYELAAMEPTSSESAMMDSTPILQIPAKIHPLLPSDGPPLSAAAYVPASPSSSLLVSTTVIPGSIVSSQHTPLLRTASREDDHSKNPPIEGESSTVEDQSLQEINLHSPATVFQPYTPHPEASIHRTPRRVSGPPILDSEDRALRTEAEHDTSTLGLPVTAFGSMSKITKKVKSHQQQQINHQDTQTAAKQRRQHKGKHTRKCLVAVTPIIALTKEEQSLTALGKLLGGRKFFYQLARERTAFAFHYFWSYVFYAVFVMLGLQERSIYYSAFALVGVLWNLTVHLSVANFKMLKLTFGMFDAGYFLVQVLLFGLSLSAVLCSSAVGWLFSIVVTLSLLSDLFFDCHPRTTRRIAAWGLAVGMVWTLAILWTLHLYVPGLQCPSHMDLATGTLVEARSSYSGWSFSLYEFCFNRGITILMLKAKLTYMAFRHPADCAIIKSRTRMRTIDAPSASSSTAVDPVANVARSNTPSASDHGNGIAFYQESFQKGDRLAAQQSTATRLCDAFHKGLLAFCGTEPIGLASPRLLTPAAHQHTMVLADLIDIQLLLSTLVSKVQSTASDASSTRRRSSSHRTAMTVPRPATANGVQLLVAVNRYKELSEEDSHTTLMIRFLGKKFTSFWFNRKVVKIPLTYLAYFSFCILSFVYGLGKTPRDKTTELLLSIVFIVSSPIVVLFYSSISNARILRECYKTYDSSIFVIEVLLNSICYCIISCQRLSAYCLAISYFISCTLLVILDSCPPQARKRTRIGLCLSVALLATNWTFTFFRKIPDMCFYHLRFSDGKLVREDEDLSLLSSDAPLSLSFYDLSLNRGFTVLFITTKWMVSAFKDPGTCLLIRSRMRIVDNLDSM